MVLPLLLPASRVASSVRHEGAAVPRNGKENGLDGKIAGKRHWNPLKSTVERVPNRLVVSYEQPGIMATAHWHAQVEVNYVCARRGFSIAEVPIVFVDRRVGESKMSTAIVLEAMFMVLRYRLFGAPSEREAGARPSAAKYSDMPRE